MGMPKNELIAKLEEISALYASTVAIQSQMDDFTPEDHYDRQINVPQFPGEYKSEKERSAWQELIGHDEEDAVQIMEGELLQPSSHLANNNYFAASTSRPL